MEEIDFNAIAHEIWATAQLYPNEGIENGVSRIETLLIANFKLPSNQVIEDGQANDCTLKYECSSYGHKECIKSCHSYTPAT